MNKQLKFIPLLLAALLLATVFSGCKKTETEPPAETPVRIPYMASPLDCTPLTEEELSFFNDEYFVLGGPCIAKWMTFSDYNAPEEINLYETFQFSSEVITGEERAAAEQALALTETGSNLVKISKSAMNKALGDYLGLTLEETDKVGLDRMTYLEDYDAYFLFRDAYSNNNSLEIYKGERDTEGNIFLFYLPDNWNADFSRILHLKELPDGSYRFLSSRWPGIPYANENASDAARSAAQNTAAAEFYKLAPKQDWSQAEPRFQVGPFVDFRVNDLALAKELTIDGERVEVYRTSYALRPLANAEITLQEGDVTTADGWITSFPTASYLIYWDASLWEDETYSPFTTMRAVITDLAPEDEGFDARIEALLEGRPDITADERATALNMIFADREKLLFSTDRYLCFYDLAAGQIDALVGLTINDGISNGRLDMSLYLLRDDGVPVETMLGGYPQDIGLWWQLPEVATQEGKWFPTEPVRSAPPEGYENVARGDEIGGADTSDWTVATRVELVPNLDDLRIQAMLSSVHPASPIPEGYIASEEAVPFDDGNGYLYSEDGTLAKLQYVQGENSWLIFEGEFD